MWTYYARLYNAPYQFHTGLSPHLRLGSGSPLTTFPHRSAVPFVGNLFDEFNQPRKL